MIVAPIIFCTVVHGIASVGEAKRVGRVAVKALIYFEIVTTIALVLGLVLVNVWAPGAGMNVDPATLADSQRRRRRAAGEAGRLRRVPRQPGPDERGRRLRRRRRPAGAVLLGDVRLRAAGPRSEGQADHRRHPRGVAGPLQDDRVRHVCRADRRVRRHRVHGGTVRAVVAARARQPRADVLRAAARCSSCWCCGRSRGDSGSTCCGSSATSARSS